jgi:hypothetical protein
MVSVEIPDQHVPLPAAQFTVPVNIAYDTALLDADDSSVTIGDVWTADGAEVVVNVNDATGLIVVWVFQAEAIAPQAGSLVNIMFRPTAQIVANTTTRIDLTTVRLNEDQILPDPAPIPGADPTDGMITFFSRPTTAIQDVSLPEGNTGQTAFAFQITLSAASVEEIRVDFQTADGTATVADNDYTPTNGTLVFAPGETQKSITVLVTGDTKVEPDEQFSVRLFSPVNVEPGRMTATGTILNDDDSTRGIRQPGGRGLCRHEYQ